MKISSKFFPFAFGFRLKVSDWNVFVIRIPIIPSFCRHIQILPILVYVNQIIVNQIRGGCSSNKMLPNIPQIRILMYINSRFFIFYCVFVWADLPICYQFKSWAREQPWRAKWNSVHYNLMYFNAYGSEMLFLIPQVNGVLRCAPEVTCPPVIFPGRCSNTQNCLRVVVDRLAVRCTLEYWLKFARLMFVLHLQKLIAIYIKSYQYRCNHIFLNVCVFIWTCAY